jgi:coenzyme PQQ synthesis protein D (PqqD)
MAEQVFQAANLEVHKVPDGYIVYQTDRDRVHYLNKTAAIILEFCDGLRDRNDIVLRVAKVFELGPSTHEEIGAALDALVKEGLILSPSR